MLSKCLGRMIFQFMRIKSSNYSSNNLKKLSVHWSKTLAWFLLSSRTTDAYDYSHPQMDVKCTVAAQEETNRLQHRKLPLD